MSKYMSMPACEWWISEWELISLLGNKENSHWVDLSGRIAKIWINA